jgi:hypothetical protein
MPTGGCEVQAEQPSDPPVHPVRFKPLLECSPAWADESAMGEASHVEDLTRLDRAEIIGGKREHRDSAPFA